MKKRLKHLITSMILTISLLMLTACGGHSSSTSDSESTGKSAGIEINIASLKGPTSIGLVKLYDDSDNENSINTYNYSIYGTADEISAGLVKGEIDIAAIPCNLASVLYGKTQGEIQIAGINTLGVLYIVQKGENISSVSDLRGKTIYTTGQGTTPEYTLRYLLSENGIDPDNDVTIKFCSEASEVVSSISALSSAVAMLPQPYVTVAQTKVDGLKVAFDVTKEWEKADKDSTVVTGVLIARKAFIEEHPEQFKAFLDEYKTSAEYANSNVEDTAELVEKFDIFKAAIAKKAIPECNVTFITGDDMKTKVSSYLKVLFDANPKAVGGKLPDDGIYYVAE